MLRTVLDLGTLGLTADEAGSSSVAEDTGRAAAEEQEEEEEERVGGSLNSG